MEPTTTLVGTATVSLSATASALATVVGAAQTSSVPEVVSAITSGLLLLSAVIGGGFAYWRYRISTLDKLVQLFDTEAHAITLWNLSQAVRGGTGGDRVFYDPGGRLVSPRAWDAVPGDDGWQIVSPNGQRTLRTWGEPYYTLFKHGFGPGHSDDGARADFSRFSWLIRRVAVACGCGSASPLETLLRPHLMRYLVRVSGSQVGDAMMHFEVVVSRLIRFFETDGQKDARWKVDRDYFWDAYGLSTPLYTSFRGYLLPEADSDSALYCWVATARCGYGFLPLSDFRYREGLKTFGELYREQDNIPLL